MDRAQLEARSASEEPACHRPARETLPREAPGPLASTRTRLLDLSIGLVESVGAAGLPPQEVADGFSPDFQLALPYRGIFVWHVGRDAVVGDANQVLFITGGERYRMTHPVAGGYEELIVTPAPEVLDEMAHAAGVPLRAHPLFRRRSRRASPRLQSFRARFLSWAHGVQRNGHVDHHVDQLSAEELVLALLRAGLDDDGPCREPGGSTRRLIRKAKAFMEAELANPIRLSDVGRAAGASPTYLTHVFRRVEGTSLHQYLTQLRLARALVELPRADDLTALALDIGFSSHSHFTAAFRRTFGATPSQFRQTARRRLRPAPL